MGEAYPGSTGGEIFNYYGTDSNANTASGDYSTTTGYNNKNATAYTLMCGSNNKTSGTGSKGSLIAGYNNDVANIQDVAICLGGNNQVYGNNQIFIGYDNIAQSSISPKSICVGRGLNVNSSSLNQKVVLGTYNNNSPTLSSVAGNLQTIIGGGQANYSGYKANAIEIYFGLNEVNYSKSFTLFPDYIGLGNFTLTNKAAVNAITPPPDPNNVTQDDRTLVTKTRVPSPLLTTATSLSENDPALDLSSDWSNVRASDTNIRFYIRINGICFESTICDCKNSDGYLQFERNAYDSNAQSTTIYQYKFSWDHTAKTLTYIELLSYDLADAGTISNVSHALSGATITVYRVETF